MTIEEQYGEDIANTVARFEDMMRRTFAELLKESFEDGYELGFRNGKKASNDVK